MTIDPPFPPTSDRGAASPEGDDPRGLIHPVSPSQERIWQLDQLGGTDPARNEWRALRLDGNLDLTVLQTALDQVVQRHAVLRATFLAVNGPVVQQVSPTARVVLQINDVRDLPGSARDTRASQIVREGIRDRFDLARGPLVRARLVRLAEDRHVLLLVSHQIVADARSLLLLLREIAATYTALAQERPARPPVPVVEFADLVERQRERLRGARREKLIDYWAGALAGSALVLQLPPDRRPPAAPTFAGARHPVHLPAELVSDLVTIGSPFGASLPVALIAAFQTLLARYSGQEDFVVGQVVDARSSEDAKGVVGPLENLLALRADLSDDPTVEILLGRTRTVVDDARAHQELPFELLVERLDQAGARGRLPLLQALIEFDGDTLDGVSLPGVTIAPFPVDPGFARSDLTLSLTVDSFGLTGAIEYRTELFGPETVACLAASFERLLRGFVANPRRRVSELRLLGGHEQSTLDRWNATQDIEASQPSLAELFERQVGRTPDAPAITFEGTSLTFRELNWRANVLARRLRELGVGHESIVGVCVEPSLDLIVALLAILKAGGTYLPLDPSLPPARLELIARDARPRLVVCLERLRSQLAVGPAPILSIDTEIEAIDDGQGENLASVASVQSLAYVLYTSGSSGTPKGVLGLQRGVINRLRWMWDTYPFEPGDVCCQKTALSWVDSVWEIFGPLLHGVRLVIAPAEARVDAARLVDLLAAEGVSRIVLVPALLRLILESTSNPASRLPRLKYWVTSGEAAPVDLWERFGQMLPDRVLINLYGSTEVSADVTSFDNREGVIGTSVPIGRPIRNTRIYVLDRHGARVPIGAPGELYVGGEGLARGYLNHPELTAERFVRDPFNADPTARLYRTGDLARFRSDGNLEYLGRVDRQLKIRGCRVEPSEVEATLHQHPEVRAAAVEAREGVLGASELVAYVVPRTPGALASTDLRAFAAGWLPSYMVPSSFVTLAELPRMVNGKVDRQALPLTDRVEAAPSRAYVAPRNAAETYLVRLWEELLDISPIGIRDDFFALGGHSLLATHLLANVEEHFGAAPPLADLFPSVTIEHLAGMIQRSTRYSSGSSLVAIQPRGSRPPLFCAHGLGGGVTDFAHLARHLDPDQPVFGLQAARYDRTGRPLTQLAEMAQQYVADMRVIQPVGPYALVGHSFGGVLAFAIARQIVSEGDQVDLLILLDSVAPGVDYYRMSWRPRNLVDFVGNLPYWLADYGRLGPRLMVARARRVARVHLQGLLPRLGLAGASTRVTRIEDLIDDVAGLGDDEKRLMELQEQAVQVYRPEPYLGSVILFRARRQPLFCSFDPTMGWDQLASGGVSVHPLPGSHVDVLFEPIVDLVAEHIKPLLRNRSMRDRILLNP